MAEAFGWTPQDWLELTPAQLSYYCQDSKDLREKHRQVWNRSRLDDQAKDRLKQLKSQGWNIKGI